MISVGPRIMAWDALIALGIFGDRMARVSEAEQLGLHSLEARLEHRIDRLVVGRIGLEGLLERLDALVRQRVGAVVAVLGIDREPIFLVLQLAEELEQALAADPRAMKIFD